MEIAVFFSLLVSLTAAGHPYSGHFETGTPHLLFGSKTGVFPLKELNSDVIGPLVLGNKLAAIIVGRNSIADIPKGFSAKGRIELRSANSLNPMQGGHVTQQQLPVPKTIKPNPVDYSTARSTGGLPFQGPLPTQQNINQLDRFNPWAGQLRSEPLLSIRHNALPFELRPSQSIFGPGPFRTRTITPTINNLSNTPNSIADRLIQRLPSLFSSRLQLLPRPAINIKPRFAASNLRQRLNFGPLSFMRSQLLKLGSLGMGQVFNRFAKRQKVAIPAILTDQVYRPLPRAIPW